MQFTKPFSKSHGTDNSTKPISESITKPHIDLLAELYALEEDDLPEDAFPITYSNILKHQKKDKKLLKLFKSSKVLKFKEFHGGGRSFKLICNNENKIVMPQASQSSPSNNTSRGLTCAKTYTRFAHAVTRVC